jgi:phospholipid/cholesterol/gamma-HCH transport system substrate-binding protein
MKITNEVKIGLFAALAITASIFGYNFLKGQNLLSDAIDVYVDFENAQQINASSPVYYRGVDIGIVKNIFFKPENNSRATLHLLIKKNPGIPTDAKVILFSNGILAGKAVMVDFDKPCNGDNCIKSGVQLKGVVWGMLESMLGTPDKIRPYIDTARTGLGGIFDDVEMRIKSPDNEIGKSLRDIQGTLLNLRQTTAALNQLMQAQAGVLSATFSNIEGITANLKANNDRISGILTDANTLTTKANTFDFSKLNTATQSATQSIDDLKKTLSEAQKALQQLSSSMVKVSEGQGTVGQLMTNDSVYQSLNLTLVQTQALMQDIRLNPKRYINLNPFRRYKNYVVPAQDPLMDTLQKRFNSTVRPRN